MAHAVHVMLLDSFAMYQRCSLRMGLNFIRFLAAKLETEKKGAPSDEGTGVCTLLAHWNVGDER